MSVCAGTKRNGDSCTQPATQDSAWCWNHDPARAEERSRNASRAASAKHSHLHGEMREMRDLIWDISVQLIEGKLHLRVRMNMTHIIQLLQAFLRAAEVELASGKEPERGSVLPDDMLEKLQHFVADKDREGSEAEARRSKMMPPAG